MTSSLFIIVRDWRGVDDGTLFVQVVSMFGKSNPYAWMLDWLAACARHGGQAPPQLDPWPPWRMSESRREPLRQAPAEWVGSVADRADSEWVQAA